MWRRDELILFLYKFPKLSARVPRSMTSCVNKDWNFHKKSSRSMYQKRPNFWEGPERRKVQIFAAFHFPKKAQNCGDGVRCALNIGIRSNSTCDISVKEIRSGKYCILYRVAKKNLYPNKVSIFRDSNPSFVGPNFARL